MLKGKYDPFKINYKIFSGNIYIYFLYLEFFLSLDKFKYNINYFLIYICYNSNDRQ